MREPAIAALSRLMGRGLAFVVAVLLAVLALVAVAETMLWLAFRLSWAAAPEIQGTLLVWFGLLAAAWGVRERLHLGVDLVARRLPARVRDACFRLVAALVLAFGALLALYGARLVGVVTNTLPATGVGAWVQYLPALVAGALIAFFALERLLAGGGLGAPEPVPTAPLPGGEGLGPYDSATSDRGEVERR